MGYNARFMKWRCPCGNILRDVSVGTTSDCCLIAQWECPACEKEVRFRVSMEELIANVPSPPQPTELTKSDEDFLKSLNIGGMPQ